MWVHSFCGCELQQMFVWKTVNIHIWEKRKWLKKREHHSFINFFLIMAMVHSAPVAFLCYFNSHHLSVWCANLLVHRLRPQLYQIRFSCVDFFFFFFLFDFRTTFRFGERKFYWKSVSHNWTCCSQFAILLSMTLLQVTAMKPECQKEDEKRRYVLQASLVRFIYC